MSEVGDAREPGTAESGVNPWSSRLLDTIRDRQGELLLFGLTPPRAATDPERVAEIAERTLARLASLQLDGVILYDIDDESDRNPDDRPFPFQATLDPAQFLREHLHRWGGPTIVYRAVGKYSPDALTTWMSEQDPSRALTVFVGASSSDKVMHTSLVQAQRLRQEQRPELTLGGVAIPERHKARENEHERLLAKQERGASFFVSQVVYDVLATKNMVSDYAYTSRERGLEPVPIIFTLSVCGSLRSLEFLQWLGVDVPRWMQNDLRYTEDPLAHSLDVCLQTARHLTGYCRRLGIPFGFNVESVSNRRVEIEASVRLAEELRSLLA